jgi:GABA(A) receptor-associated protein
MAFRTVHTFEERITESTRIKDKFPGRIPVIVEPSIRGANLPPLDKQKFLVPGDLSIGQFIFVIRKRMVLSQEQALFVFVGNTLPTTSTLLRELYATYKDHDGFLYMSISGENTFGKGKSPFDPVLLDPVYL